MMQLTSLKNLWKRKGPETSAISEVEKLNRLVNQLEATRQELEVQQGKMEEALLLVEKDNYRKTEELLEAQRLQLSMLPGHNPFMPGYEIALSAHPASEVGGDYYDYHFSRGYRRLHLVLGDATGHGFKPGILVATAKSYFKTLAGKEEGEEILVHISDAIRSLNAKGLYMGLALMDIEGDRLTIVSSGMPPLFIYNKARNEVKQHRLKGLFLGVNYKLQLHRKVFRLSKGDAVLFMTDGMAETQNSEGEMLGYEAIADQFRKAASGSTADIIEQLNWLADSWSNGDPQKDDMSMIVLKKQ